MKCTQTRIPQSVCYFLKIVTPNTSIIRHKPKNMPNKIFATEAAPSEIPVKPNIPATIAMIKKEIDHFNITIVFILSEVTACNSCLVWF
jgi:hypothetical protein